MNFWFNTIKNWKGPSYKYIYRFKLKSGTVKKKPITNVKFVRQQKVFGKGGGKSLVKKKTNLLIRSFRIYFLSGIIQNLPPLSTLLSVYNINTQKFCEEISSLFKNNFFESIPVILLVDIFKDCTYKFFLLGFRFNYLIQSLVGFLEINNKLFIASNNLKVFFDLDLWFILFVQYLFIGKNKFWYENFIRMHYSTVKVLGLRRIKNYFFSFNED